MATLNALCVTPLSGPLARYGRAVVEGLRLWAEEAAELPPPWSGVRLEVRDARPDPEKALADLGPRTNVLFGPYGSGPTIRVARATDRVVWNHGGATSRLRRPEFPNVVNVLSPASSYFEGTLHAVSDAWAGASTVVVFHSTTGFGTDVGRGAAVIAERLGFDVSTRTFEPGASYEEAWAVPDADVLLVAGGFQDELRAAEVLLKRSWRVAGFVGAGTEEVLASLGPRREGLCGPAQWFPAAAPPAPDVGPGPGWFVRTYLRRTGDEPPYPAAQAFAAGLVYGRGLWTASEPRDQGVQHAVSNLDCTTLYGRFRLDPSTGLQVGHRVVAVQWQEGRRRVIWPPEVAERSFRPLRPV